MRGENVEECQDRARLGLGDGAIMLLLLVVVGFSMMKINTLNSEITILTDDQLPKMESANQTIGNANIVAPVMRNVVLETGKDFQEAELKRLQDSHQPIVANVEKLRWHDKKWTLS